MTAVAIIGAGYAGLAAAVALAQDEIPVTVFEAARELGGRARRVELDGRPLDNGQHILIGAYTELLRLQALVGVSASQAYLRLPLTLDVRPDLLLRAPWSGASGLAAAFFFARGLRWRDRLAAARFIASIRRKAYRFDADVTVATLLAQTQQPEPVRRLLWEPLCVAALNTPSVEASAQVFANVLRDTLEGPRGASDLLLPRVDLSALFPTPAATFVGARGGTVHTGVSVRSLSREGTVWRVTPTGPLYDAVILATSPVSALRLLPRECETARLAIGALEQQPITTIYLQYPAHVSLSSPMIGLTAGHGQWVFDRAYLGGPKGLLAVVISASREQESMSLEALEGAIHLELNAALGPLPEPCWTRAIAERRATFSCTPSLARPGNASGSAGLFIAGDYTASDYPGTLESAVRSGTAAAGLALDWISTRRITATPPQHRLGDPRR